MADIQQYLNLITSQHSKKSKFTAWLTAVLEKIDDASTLGNDLYTYFDLDNAVGVQQDIIGEIIGVSRKVNFVPSDGSSQLLDNNTYKQVLQAKIAQNQWDGTLATIGDIWNAVFPDARLIIQDNQNMTINAKISLFTQMQKDLAANGYIIPKPQGVLLNLILQYYLNDLAKGTDSIFSIKVTPGSGQPWGSGRKWGQGFWFSPKVYTPPSIVILTMPEVPKGTDNLIVVVTNKPYTWGTGRIWGQSTY